ncbi:MAG: hypothetical protein ACKOX7_02975 [Bacteroidota bacterium]
MNSDRKPADSRHYLRLNVLAEVIASYDGKQPLHRYLASFFKSNPGFGSSDRKLYRRWIYAWFRLGKLASQLDFNKRVLVAYYLVNGLNDELSLFLNASSGFQFPIEDLSLRERIGIVHTALGLKDLDGIFPFQSQPSSGMDRILLAESILSQPDVFIRVKRGFESKVQNELNVKNISFEKTDLVNCWKLPAATNLQELKSFAVGYFEVQDYGSQAIADLVPAHKYESWWDVCCGAGGKTLYLTDKFPGIKLHCTDKRESILVNLKERVTRGKYRGITSSVLDAAIDIPNTAKFNGVLVDAPCSGSGTWSRNPENLVFFDEAQLPEYSKTQSTILSNVSRAVLSGSYLVYMTCSVFAMENEQVVSSLIQGSDYHLIAQKMLKGYEHGCDSLFVAVLRKN